MKPGTRAVLNLLRAYPDGICRRVFAQHDIYEPSARIGELRDQGFWVDTQPCRRHRHRNRVVSYTLTKESISA